MIHKIHEARYHRNTKLAASGGARQTAVEFNFTDLGKHVHRFILTSSSFAKGCQSQFSDWITGSHSLISDSHVHHLPSSAFARLRFQISNSHVQAQFRFQTHRFRPTDFRLKSIIYQAHKEVHKTSSQNQIQILQKQAHIFTTSDFTGLQIEVHKTSSKKYKQVHKHKTGGLLLIMCHLLFYHTNAWACYHVGFKSCTTSQICLGLLGGPMIAPSWLAGPVTAAPWLLWLLQHGKFALDCSPLATMLRYRDCESDDEWRGGGSVHRIGMTIMSPAIGTTKQFKQRLGFEIILYAHFHQMNNLLQLQFTYQCWWKLPASTPTPIPMRGTFMHTTSRKSCTSKCIAETLDKVALELLLVICLGSIQSRWSI